MLKHFKKEESITLVVLIFFAAISFLLDEQAFSFFDSIKNVAFDSLMSLINNPITLSVVLVIILINILVHSKYKVIKKLIATIITSVIISNILKLSFTRPRPFGLEKFLPFTNFPDYSFPSGHAFVAFSMLPILNDRYPKLKVLLFALAILVAVARVYLGKHYLSDIAAGAALGYLAGLVILRYK